MLEYLEQSVHVNKAADENESQLLIKLRSQNLLLKRNPTLVPHIKLCQVYDYLQMNQNGLREEVLVYFNHCCKPIEQARIHFQFIVACYPWTNRKKYFLLSAILNTHNIDKLLQYTQNNSKDFFNGLRLSLSYKRLLSCSQYLVKSLSNQKSYDLLELSATILTVGTLKEISNFYANWFNRIQQQEKLFQLIYDSPKMANAFEMYQMHKNSTEEYRFILIFNMYSRYIHNSSKLVFFKISTELIMNCFNYEIKSQILIYKFVCNNLNSFALEDSLEYLANFIIHHKHIEHAQMRTNILGQISSIINYVAKTYRKTNKKQKNENSLNSLNKSICDFFKKLNQLIIQNIENDVYQPKIFSLKLLDILLKSLYQASLEKNAKNCIITENKELGNFLLNENVFNANEVKLKLINALNDATGFDDALDLIVQLLKRMQNVELNEIIATGKECCENVDIDKCALSARFALVALNIEQMYFSTLYKYAIDKLIEVLNEFQKDPLNTCKIRCHIFGFLNVINLSIAHANEKFECSKYEELLKMLENILNVVLEFLKSPYMCTNKENVPIAASFQDMDESLELLVKNSHYIADNHVECRKFLLMSFWLTLKACCDTATTLACILSPHDKELIELEKLQRCININVSVLTRCRHKGAIEAAGLSIGKLTKHLTSHKFSLLDVNKILCDALSVLFLTENLVSTTRRGAGFSIMFLHIMKNDQQIGKPLLKHAINKIFKLLESSSVPVTKTQIQNCDRIETLCLHFLCVLSKDAELRDAVAAYRNEIILAAITNIDDPDWTVCNAALQLFGALVPKIVGQKQATDFDVAADWESNDVCFIATATSMPKSFEYILNYCNRNSSKTNFTRSIILFLEFLSKLEHLSQDDDDETQQQVMLRLRELMWSLLRHCDEKVRKLAALCFVRAHEFSYELPEMLLRISDLIFHVRNENFFIGLIFVLQAGFLKMQNEAIYTLSSELLMSYFQNLRLAISKNFIEVDFKFYTQTKLLEMLHKIGFDNETDIVNKLQSFCN